MFDREIMQYYDEIYRFCYHHVGSRQTAEDLCQDTFIRFLESASSPTFRFQAKSYLYTIARNLCIDYYRKAKLVYTNELPEATDRESDEELATVETLEMLSHLEEELREVIILRYFQDLKFREIATIMNISQSKAKFLVAKALAQLQKITRVSKV